MNAPVARLKSPAEAGLSAQFAALPARGAASAQAFAAFEKTGLPHRRIEAWHYTDLRAKMREALPRAAAPDGAALTRAHGKLRAPMFAARIVLLDGVFQSSLSTLPALPGLRVSALAAASPAQIGDAARADAMVQLHLALSQGGARIEVAANTVTDQPIEIAHLYSGREEASHHARVEISVGAHASASFVEWRGMLGSAPVQINDVTRVEVGDHATCNMVASLDERLGHDALCVLTFDAVVGAYANLNSCAFIKGGETLRRQIFARLQGEHTKLTLNGVSLLRGTQHADTTLVVDHAAAHCESREFFRHIVDGEATGVFQGKIIVRPGAQKTDGGMRSNTLLLSEEAAMMNKPELEIFADDVVCGHGATCGELDQNHLFYLMARGIPRKEAEGLLLQAFASEAFEAVENDKLREALQEGVAQWLGSRAA
jgi:Fe-S cluster assembly protein SufD